MIRLTTSSAVCTEALRAALPLYGTAATRAIEQSATEALPPHALMQRAGLAVARLALALAPHARHVWIACGAGNNGGDGLEAAMHLHHWGKPVSVSWLGSPDHSPTDARAAWQRAQAAGIPWVDEPQRSQKAIWPSMRCWASACATPDLRAPQACIGRSTPWAAGCSIWAEACTPFCVWTCPAA